MRKLLIGAAALAVATPAIAQVAQAPAPKAQHGAKAMKVQTRAEVQAKVARHFARIDTNRDGFVTKAEADAAHSLLADRMRERSGIGREKAFDRLDTNNDGAISRAEWDARSVQRQQRATERADRSGDGRPDRGGASMRGMHGLGGQMFDMADANRDSRVSLAEAQAAALRHFDMADTNRDGQVTPDEHRQMRQRMHAQQQRD